MDHKRCLAILQSNMDEEITKAFHPLLYLIQRIKMPLRISQPGKLQSSIGSIGSQFFGLPFHPSALWSPWLPTPSISAGLPKWAGLPLLPTCFLEAMGAQLILGAQQILMVLGAQGAQGAQTMNCTIAVFSKKTVLWRTLPQSIIACCAVNIFLNSWAFPVWAPWASPLCLVFLGSLGSQTMNCTKACWIYWAKTDRLSPLKNLWDPEDQCKNFGDDAKRKWNEDKAKEKDKKERCLTHDADEAGCSVGCSQELASAPRKVGPD